MKEARLRVPKPSRRIPHDSSDLLNRQSAIGDRPSQSHTWLLLCALFPFLLLASCNNRGASGAAQSVSAPAVPVSAATASVDDVPIQVKAIGWVEAYASVTVKPQIEGQITEIHFTDGQEVKAGDLLYSIDPRPFVAALASRRSQPAQR